MASIAQSAVARSPARTLTFLATVIGVVLLLTIYLSAFELTLRPFHLYPIIWIATGLAVLCFVRRPSIPGTHQFLPVGLALGYFVVLLLAGGIIGPGPTVPILGSAPTSDAIYGVRIATAVPPGYGPALLYVGPYLRIGLIPYLFVGYLALAWLVYVTALAATRASIPGLVGIFACVGCTWPVMAALLGGSAGVVGSVTAAAYAHAYPLSTIAFLLAVGLLVWTRTKLESAD